MTEMIRQSVGSNQTSDLLSGSTASKSSCGKSVVDMNQFSLLVTPN